MSGSLPDYVAIDFETANYDRGSACSVGLVRVRNGVVVDEQHWFIHPPAVIDDFDDFNIMLHGITPEMVAGAPTWEETLGRLIEYIGDDVLVAHYAPFDMGVIRDACEADELPVPEFTAYCTCSLSRQVFDLPSHSLPYVVEACGAELVDHHDALADARAVVVIMETLLVHPKLSLYAVGERHGKRVPLITPDIAEMEDPEGFLYGKTVVFTGKLLSMRRQDAWDRLGAAGGTPEYNVTQHTDVLVCGLQHPRMLRPGHKMSSKARKALALRDKGQAIELMSELDFLRAVSI